DPLLNARLAGYTRKGFSARYQACRPKPPGALVELLLRLAGTRRPHVVVDLGSGTGISTRIWAAHARQVIGVEPLDEMREIAETVSRVHELRARHGIRSEQQRWSKEEHVERMRRSSMFRYLKEIVLHNTEPCTAERLIGFACSIGFVLPVLDLGLPDDELGLT